MKKKVLSLLLSAVVIGGLGFSTSASAATNGWALNSDYKWSYYNNGQRVTGWIKPDGYNWYYLNSNGDMLTGFQKINGKWYYLEQNSGKYEGAMIFDNTLGPYSFNMDGEMTVKGNALLPDEAYNKLKLAMLNKHKEYANNPYLAFSNFIYEPPTRTFTLSMAGYVDDTKTNVGMPISEGFIDPATGKVTLYY